MNSIKIITESFEETQKAGAKFATRMILAQGLSLSGAVVVALYGNLGSGKTTFAQGMAKGLGITKRLISPTFIITRSYTIPGRFWTGSSISSGLSNLGIEDPRDLGPRGKDHSSGQARTVTDFYHIDLYRVQSKKDIEGLGIKEILTDPQNIVAIEWAEKLGKLLPKERWGVKFQDLGEEKKKITIHNLY